MCRDQESNRLRTDYLLVPGSTLNSWATQAGFSLLLKNIFSYLNNQLRILLKECIIYKTKVLFDPCETLIHKPCSFPSPRGNHFSFWGVILTDLCFLRGLKKSYSLWNSSLFTMLLRQKWIQVWLKAQACSDYLSEWDSYLTTCLYLVFEKEK